MTGDCPICEALECECNNGAGRETTYDVWSESDLHDRAVCDCGACENWRAAEASKCPVYDFPVLTGVAPDDLKDAIDRARARWLAERTPENRRALIQAVRAFFMADPQFRRLLKELAKR